MKSFAAALVAVGALVLATAAQATTETATAGGVTAHLSYDRTGDFEYSNVRLQVDRQGRTALDAPVPPPCDQCRPTPADPGHSLTVTDLDRDGEPEVIVDQYTGGAHCCFVSVIYGYEAATGGYGHLVQDWRDAGYTPKDLDGDGRPELVSADARFDYEFTAHVFSAFPIQIWRYRGGALADVTRAFPSAVRQDAKRKLSFYRRILREPKDARDVRGALAAYVADRYLLGAPGRGWRLVLKARRRGQLRGLGGPQDKRYVKRLRRFLRELGYVR
jgi:hypothetical protein